MIAKLEALLDHIMEDTTLNDLNKAELAEAIGRIIEYLE